MSGACGSGLEFLFRVQGLGFRVLGGTYVIDTGHNNCPFSYTRYSVAIDKAIPETKGHKRTTEEGSVVQVPKRQPRFSVFFRAKP